MITGDLPPQFERDRHEVFRRRPASPGARFAVDPVKTRWSNGSEEKRCARLQARP